MTEDKKNTPTEDKITELSAWQKRNKEYLEKRALEKEKEPEKDELEEETSTEGEDLLDQEVASVDEEDSDEREDTEEEEDDSAEETDSEENLASEVEESRETETLSTAEDPEEPAKQERKLFLFDRLKVRKEKKEPTVAKRHIYRAIPVIGISSMLALASLYFLSPLSTKKVIEFSGNKAVDQQVLYEKSRIKEEDYTLTTFLHKSVYERNMKTASPWIKAVHMQYQFPVTFKVQVTEHQVVAYYVTGGDHYPVLENGEVVETVTPASDLPSSYISLTFSDREMVRQYVQQMKSISSSITDKIVSVDLTPSKVTKDLVTLTMKNGNKILVPLSHITRKLPYYKSISKQVEDGSIIDMEAGVFSYNEQAMVEAKEKSEKEKTEKTEETANTENQSENSGETAQDSHQDSHTEEQNHSENQ